MELIIFLKRLMLIASIYRAGIIIRYCSLARLPIGAGHEEGLKRSKRTTFNEAPTPLSLFKWKSPSSRWRRQILRKINRLNRIIREFFLFFFFQKNQSFESILRKCFAIRLIDRNDIWKFRKTRTDRRERKCQMRAEYLRARPPPPSASPPNTVDTLGARVSTGKEVEALSGTCLCRCSPRSSRSPAVYRAPNPWSDVSESLGERVSSCTRTRRWQTGFATVCASRANTLDLGMN